MAGVAAETLASLPDGLRARRVLFEATLLPNYLANSHYPVALFGEIDAVPIGTRPARGVYVTPNNVEDDAPAKTYVLSGTNSSIDRLEEVLSAREDQVPDAIRADVVKLQGIAAAPIERILRMGAGRFIEIEGLLAMEVVINPIVASDGSPDTEQLREVLAKWDAYTNELGGRSEPEWVRSHGALTFLPTLLPAEALQDAARFNPLRTLRPMPRVVVAPRGPLRAIGGPRLGAPSAAPATGERIAIFDGTVVDTVPAIAPYVTRTDLTSGAAEDPRSAQHATTVASAALFGSIDESQGLVAPPAALDSFRVWPPPAEHREDTHMYWVLDQIVAELTRHPKALVSLSIGPEFTLDDDTGPHRWTAALDALAARHGTLFCVAAGNTGEDDAEAGANRLGVPADLINGLSVGACDERPPRTWTRAPYSSVGPGRPGARVAPQLLACGGHLPDSPFVCMVPGGQLAHSHGTSLAAPSLARSLAELADALKERSNANTLRAFAVHFAERDPALSSSDAGYGRAPDSFLGHLQCEQESASILFADTLRRGQTMMLRIPLSDELLDSLGKRYISLRWTLAFTSPVDPADPVDYGRAGVTAYFRPHAERFNMNLEGATPIPVNRLEEPDFYSWLIRDEHRTPSDRPVTRPLKEYAPETERRQDGKWETIVRIDDRMQASTLYRPSFDVHLLTRTAGQLSPASADEHLAYALLVTITGPTGVPIYDAVRAHAPALVPVAARAPIRVQS